MAEHFNKLTPAELERLTILAEECAEVIQAVGKILRHGYASEWIGRSNRNSLEIELGHLVYAYERMAECRDIDAKSVAIYATVKAKKIGPYLHHQETESCQ